MCLRKNLLTLILVQILLEYSEGQIHKKFFRKDYKFIEETQNFYKIHTIQKSWVNAKKTCSMEGATFYYAEDRAEFEAVAKFWNETQRSPWIFVGISDVLAKGVFETVDGVPVIDVFNNWEPGEPNDGNGIEDCVTMGQLDGSMNDIDCNRKFPFICKKTLASLSWNVECDMPNKDYVYNANFGKCYKFSLKPMNWIDAYTLCSAEQSYLAIINSQDEANYFVDLTEKTPKNIKNNDILAGAVFLGFHNRNKDGWTTIKGDSLEDTGYSVWGNQQPDGGDNELCGSMFYNGHLNDIRCDQKCFFICERDVQTHSINDRFGE